MLTRVCLGDPGTVATLEATGRAVTELAQRRLMAMVEPFLSVRDGDRVRNLLDPDNTIKSIHIASGLGASSAYTWMKLPVVDELERVMEATTLPTLLLGGDPPGTRRTPTPRGTRRSTCRPSAAWSSAGPCCSRRTATSPRPSTSRPSWCTEWIEDAQRTE